MNKLLFLSIIISILISFECKYTPNDNQCDYIPCPCGAPNSEDCGYIERIIIKDLVINDFEFRNNSLEPLYLEIFTFTENKNNSPNNLNLVSIINKSITNETIKVLTVEQEDDKYFAKLINGKTINCKEEYFYEGTTTAWNTNTDFQCRFFNFYKIYYKKNELLNFGSIYNDYNYWFDYELLSGVDFYIPLDTNTNISSIRNLSYSNIYDTKLNLIKIYIKKLEAKATISESTLTSNSLSIPRKYVLENRKSEAMKVEVIEKDFDLSKTADNINLISWSTTTTTLPPLSAPTIIYQTKSTYTGPLYCNIYNLNTNQVISNNIIRGYPLHFEKNLPKLDWQKRLTTTEIKSIYYPYEYEYYAVIK